MRIAAGAVYLPNYEQFFIRAHGVFSFFPVRMQRMKKMSCQFKAQADNAPHASSGRGR
jgi:hypothetical protein